MTVRKHAGIIAGIAGLAVATCPPVPTVDDDPVLLDDLGPSAVISIELEPCYFEDGSSPHHEGIADCYWNALDRGSGTGDSFAIINGEYYYSVSIEPVTD